jgi:hypothetical protein
MRLPQIASVSLLSLGLIAQVAANPVPVPVPVPKAFALALPELTERTDSCPISCNTICCTTSQYCSSWANSQCGEGEGTNDTGSTTTTAAAAATTGTQYYTSTILITKTGIDVITSVSTWSSVYGNPSGSGSSNPSGSGSGGANYPTLTPTAGAGAGASSTVVRCVPIPNPPPHKPPY